MNVSHATTPPPRYALHDLVARLDLDSVVLTGRCSKKTPQASQRNKHARRGANNAPIPASGRNNALASLAGSMRARGMTHDAILAALLEENQVRCQPPIDEWEVESIANSISQYAPNETDGVLKTLTDTSNADRFGNRWGEEVRFVPEWKTWLRWDGTAWKEDNDSQIVELAKQVARDIYVEGNLVADTNVRNKIARHSNASQQEPKLRAMLRLAESLPQLVVHANELDRDPLLLGVGNGVVDLISGKLRAATPQDLITRLAPVNYDPKAICPEFEKFLTHIMGNNRDLIDYVQRVIGYALTGDTREQCLFFLYGRGANGKSTLLNVINDLLGPRYARQTPCETLMARNGGRTATNDLARLQSIRVVITNEVEDGSLLAESLIKQMTGGDKISARFLYKEYVEFLPEFKIFIAGNHKPIIRGDDNGIWRRIHLVPFDVTIPPEQRDQRLLEKLRAELPGILNWAIEGCLDWQGNGLKPPLIITDAVKQYRDEMDILGQWIVEQCDLGASAEAAASCLYLNYRDWAYTNGYRPMSNGPFGRKMVERFERKRKNDGNVYLGIKAK